MCPVVGVPLLRLLHTAWAELATCVLEAGSMVGKVGGEELVKNYVDANIFCIKKLPGPWSCLRPRLWSLA